MIFHQAPPVRDYTRLRVPQIEKIFVQTVIDLKQIIVLDGVDIQPDGSGFCVRCYDLRGPLPDTVIEDTRNGYLVLNHIIREAAKRISMARIRHELAEMFPSCEFLLPTTRDKGA